KIDVGKDANGDAKNEIRFAIMPNNKDWETYQKEGGLWKPAGVTSSPNTQASTPAPAAQEAQATANPGRPSWAQ
ncbi:MAG: hypothetical protein HOJ94_00650, partial [Alphaproteobacteria bacterium]|nr:hypothetical protein [Alphaproteobacteria bacterium]